MLCSFPTPSILNPYVWSLAEVQRYWFLQLETKQLMYRISIKHETVLNIKIKSRVKNVASIHWLGQVWSLKLSMKNHWPLRWYLLFMRSDWLAVVFAILLINNLSYKSWLLPPPSLSVFWATGKQKTTHCLIKGHQNLNVFLQTGCHFRIGLAGTRNPCLLGALAGLYVVKSY